MPDETNNTPSLVSVHHLTVKFGSHVIVDKVSFELARRDVLAVIGPNGSGKTTLLKAILGLIPYEGEVHWHDKPRIGYVPQRINFDRTLPITVEELFMLRARRGFWSSMSSAQKETASALRTVGAERVVQKRVGDLSGGELQRVLIAYSLVGKPDVLFFDEPSAGIDIGGEETVYNLIHRLAHETGLTVFLISHDLDVVYRHATQVLCLNKKMICHGVPREVLTGDVLEKLYGQLAGTYEHHHEPV
ncbi:metal ABC transporter ATP-binding protein [Candidatus Uhrbacteria bacterium]|nr:metal ABC transporter ATP-binding protein [Candidatus Uhrbacteria bacterium]